MFTFHIPETTGIFFYFWVPAFVGFLVSLFYVFKEGTGSKKLNWLLPITAILAVIGAIIY